MSWKTITLVVEIENEEEAKWIWKNHMGDNAAQHGVKVLLIQNGHLPHRVDKFLAEINEILDENSCIDQKEKIIDLVENFDFYTK